MTMINQLNNDLATYRKLSSDEDKRTFLDGQKAKIAQMTAEQRSEHQKAIAEKVAEIARRVEEAHQVL